MREEAESGLGVCWTVALLDEELAEGAKTSYDDRDYDLDVTPSVKPGEIGLRLGVGNDSHTND